MGLQKFFASFFPFLSEPLALFLSLSFSVVLDSPGSLVL